MMNEDKHDLRARTKSLALRIIRMRAALPRGEVARILGNQILRCSSSAGAHYREACRARSTPEFVSKLEVALQELDETGYWLELLAESEIVPAARLTALRQETGELIAILVASVRTAKKRLPPDKRRTRGPGRSDNPS